MSSDTKLLKLIQKDLMENYSIEDIVLMLSNQLAKTYVAQQKHHKGEMPAHKITGIDVWFARFVWEAQRNKSRLSQEKIAIIETFLKQYREHLLGNLSLEEITKIRDDFEETHKQDIDDIYAEEPRKKLVVKKPRVGGEPNQYTPLVTTAAMVGAKRKTPPPTQSSSRRSYVTRQQDQEIANVINENKSESSEHIPQTELDEAKTKAQKIVEETTLAKIKSDNKIPQPIKDEMTNEIETAMKRPITGQVKIQNTVTGEKMVLIRVGDAQTCLGTLNEEVDKKLIKNYVSNIFSCTFAALGKFVHMLVPNFVVKIINNLIGIDIYKDIIEPKARILEPLSPTKKVLTFCIAGVVVGLVILTALVTVGELLSSLFYSANKWFFDNNTVGFFNLYSTLVHTVACSAAVYAIGKLLNAIELGNIKVWWNGLKSWHGIVLACGAISLPAAREQWISLEEEFQRAVSERAFAHITRLKEAGLKYEPWSILQQFRVESASPRSRWSFW